jgi:hypothetical protein
MGMQSADGVAKDVLPGALAQTAEVTVRWRKHGAMHPQR